MSRIELLEGLRHLLELERASGIEWTLRPAAGLAPPVRPATPPAAASVPPAPAPAPPPTPVPGPPMSVLVPPLPAIPAGPASAELEAVAAAAAACRACGLCSGRSRVVPGEGDPQAVIAFVGEGPGADEDASGRPFVGRAGELLTAMIKAMGFERHQVWIGNVVKCRPPGNRAPEPAEAAACLPFIERQLLAIRPQVICTLGNTPLRALLGDQKLGITKLRGSRQDWRGIPLVPTFHPAYLLRNPPAKKPCWEDLKEVLKVIGREPPKR